MFRSINTLLLVLYGTFLSVVKAPRPEPRAHHSCVLLSSTIYCYGGVKRKPIEWNGDQVIQSGIFLSLDLSYSTTVGDIGEAWNSIDEDIGPNFFFAMAPLPEINYFVIDGGRGSGDDNLLTQEATYLYDVEKKQWDSQTGSLRGRVREHSHVGINWQNSTVFFAGGKRTELVENKNRAFPSFMTVFDALDVNNWRKYADMLHGVGEDVRVRHKGALGLDGHTIYYVGGYYPTSIYMNSSYELVNMSHIQTYDTINAAWGNIEANGLQPSGRIDHTLTMKPSTGEFILYGGIDGVTKNLNSDVFYILNNDTGNWAWKNISLNATESGAQGPGPIYGHSAVLAGNSCLFIIFGCVSSVGEATSDVYVLDIEKWEWRFSVPSIKTQESGGSNINNNNNNDSDTWIAGAVLGTVIGAGLGVSIIVFFVLRKLRARRNKLVKSSSSNGVNYNISSSTEFPIDNPHSHCTPTTNNDTTSRDENTTAVPSISRNSQYMSVKPDGASIHNHENSSTSTRLVMERVKPDFGPR